MIVFFQCLRSELQPTMILSFLRNAPDQTHWLSFPAACLCWRVGGTPHSKDAVGMSECQLKHDWVLYLERFMLHSGRFTYRLINVHKFIGINTNATVCCSTYEVCLGICVTQGRDHCRVLAMKRSFFTLLTDFNLSFDHVSKNSFSFLEKTIFSC